MYKSIFLFTAVILFNLVTLYSQDDNARHGYIGASIGAAFPIGDLGDTDPNNEGSGYAETGLSLQLINLGIMFSENIGIAGSWSGGAHSMDVDKLVSDFSNADPSLYWKAETSTWSYGNLMVGLLVSFPNDKMDFDLRGMGGISSAFSPEITVTAYDGSTVITLVQESTTSTSFAYSFGAGLRFHLGEKTDLITFLDYQSADHAFTATIKDFYGGYMDNEWEANIASVSFTLGFAYRLK